MILEEYKKLRDSQTSLTQLFRNVETTRKFSSSEEKREFLQLLLADLLEKDWDENLQLQALSTIKVLGRDPVGSEPLFSKEGTHVLAQLAGVNKSTMVIDTPSSREALICIANCILLNESVKVYLEEEHVVDGCQFMLKSAENLHLESHFLLCRILFFMTVGRSDLVDQLVQQNIATSINKILVQNVGVLENPETRQQINLHAPINPYTVTSEALKLLFNLMLVALRKEPDPSSPSSSEDFKSCLAPILKLIFVVPYFKPQPLVPPHSQAIHALMQFDYDTIAAVWTSETWTRALYEGSDPYTYIATRFVGLLNRAIRILIPTGDPDHDTGEQVDATLAPLLLVIANLASEPKIKQIFAQSMLPNEKDRLIPVNEGDSLSAYLIRIMTSTMLPQTRGAASETLFILCDNDAAKLTEKVGYGNAAGFLVNKGISFDQPTHHHEENDKDVNPITGQYVSEEKLPDLKDMTDEEKEREAERLFVLFERLKKTGIIDVENPIAKAMREGHGRFEEVNEDSDSD